MSQIVSFIILLIMIKEQRNLAKINKLHLNDKNIYFKIYHFLSYFWSFLTYTQDFVKIRRILNEIKGLQNKKNTIVFQCYFYQYCYFS